MKIRKSRTGVLHLSGGPSAANCSSGNRGMNFVGEVGPEAAKLLPSVAFCKKCFGSNPIAMIDRVFFTACDPFVPPKPIREGKKLFGEGVDASGIAWAVFRAADLPADDREAAEILELGACYGGPGAYFQREPNFRRIRGHVLVTVSFGYDC